MRFVRGQIILGIVGFVSVGIVFPSTTRSADPIPEEIQTLRSEIQALKEGQQAIKKELESIKELLTVRQKPQSSVQDINLTFSVANDPAKGKSDARLTLIEFTDYQCPYCARHTRNVLPKLEKEFIDTGKVRYVLKDFPLVAIHPFAAKAHEAAHCAGEQGKYWEMHDQLFTNQKALQAENLAGYAEVAGVSDGKAFQACVDNGKFSKLTKASMAEGTKAGVRGTPSFLLGVSEADGTVKALKLIRGAQPYLLFQQQIQALLTPKKGQGKPTSGDEK